MQCGNGYRHTRMLIFFLAMSSIVACSGSRSSEGASYVTGVAVMVGNEPFTAISLQATDGITYRLQADSLTLSAFRHNQGREFQVAGTIKKEPMGPVLLVESFVKK